MSDAMKDQRRTKAQLIAELHELRDENTALRARVSGSPVSDAEHQLAAERIRAEAMAMRGSDDLYALTATFFTEVRGLGIDTWYLSLAFIDDGKLTTYCNALANWASMGLELRQDRLTRFRSVRDDALISVDHGDREHVFKGDKIRAFETQQVSSAPSSGDIEAKRRQVLNNWTGSEADVERVAERLCEDEWYHQVPFSHGVVSFTDPNNRVRTVSAEHIATVQALTEALSLGYMRFQDFQRLEQASVNKSQFLRRMSHDLRSPMNAIIGYTRLLQRRLADRMDEREARNLGNIETSSNNLLNLINDILDLSRIEAGRNEVNRQPVDVRALMNECADALESIVKAGVTLNRDLAAVGQISSDPDRLRQVVMNLLGNATKFTEAGSITLSLHKVGDTVELSVADTGIGIPAEDLPHIFDEFRQVERQGGEGGEGTGLGLTIAKKTVELLGGEISAASEVGVGTTFTVRLGDVAL